MDIKEELGTLECELYDLKIQAAFKGNLRRSLERSLTMAKDAELLFDMQIHIKRDRIVRLKKLQRNHLQLVV